jgi:hypothetical protein
MMEVDLAGPGWELGPMQRQGGSGSLHSSTFLISFLSPPPDIGPSSSPAPSHPPPSEGRAARFTHTSWTPSLITIAPGPSKPGSEHLPFSLLPSMGFYRHKKLGFYRWRPQPEQGAFESPRMGRRVACSELQLPRMRDRVATPERSWRGR